MYKQNRNTTAPNLPIKASVLAVALAFSATAMAEDESDEIQRLIKPESSITVGIGQIDNHNQRFGMYNGMHNEGTIGIGDFSIIRRDDETGTWFRASGRNLGVPEAELRLEHERQGHWQYFAEFDQMTRYTPYQVSSRLQGIGTNTLTYPNTAVPQSAATIQLSDLKTERLGSKLGFSHFLSPEFEFRLVFQNVDKKGERPFGRGTIGAQEFLVEPIDSTTRQLDAVLNYTGEKLQLSGGYYGTWFHNANNQLNVNGGDALLRNAASPNLPFSVISLPPDNFSHQFHLSGGYQFTDKTNGSFKVAHTSAYQEDGFVSVPSPTSGGLPPGGLNMSGRSNLGGHLDTTLVNLGVTSRPLRDLSLLGSFRYEDRHDLTPVTRYINVTSTTSSTDGFNEPRSLKITSGKFEASYLLPGATRLTAGIEEEQKEHSVTGVRIVGFRDRTDETSYRLELKKTLTEDLNGALAYVHSDRSGSTYQTLQTWNATTGQFNSGASYSNRIQPIYISDRIRDKVRLLTDWTPFESLNLQLVVEDTSDNYGPGRDSLNIGAREGSSRLYSLDTTWTVSEKWRLNAWVSRNETKMDQATGNSLATLWTSGQSNQVSMLGTGVRGKLTELIDIGADFMMSHDKTSYQEGGAAASSPLPDITYDQTTFKLYGRYAFSKDTKIRLDYVRDHRRINDWTWDGTATSGPFVYSDGTTLYQNPNETVQFLGISFSYAFR
jgi:MtrB/PioB family decaheme-associated outer membrane protein